MTPQEKFENWYIPEPNTGCWLWLGRFNNGGYGSFYYPPSVDMAHRASWKLAHGPIPLNMWVLHRCDHKWCVNPDHLFLGTNSDNQKDARAKGIKTGIFYYADKQRARTHCRHGHEYTPENTRLQNGVRVCKRCGANNEARRRQRLREAATDLALL